MAILYVSRAEYKDRLGITDDDHDFMVDRVLDGASRWVEQVCGRRFYTTASDETRYYTAEWYWQVDVPDDVLSITSLTTDANGDGTYETTWTEGTDFYLAPINAVADGVPFTSIMRKFPSGRFSFPSYINAVRIVGRFGYCQIEDVPAGVRNLTMMAADLDGGVNDLVVPGVASYKLGNELTVTMGGRNVPSSSKALIDQFRRGNRYIA